MTDTKTLQWYWLSVRFMLAIVLYLAILLGIAAAAGPLCILALVLSLPLVLKGLERLDPNRTAL